jgi:hypothetical protein
MSDDRKVPKLTFGVQIGGNALAACFIVDLPNLGGAEKIRKLGVPVRTLVSFEGHERTVAWGGHKIGLALRRVLAVFKPRQRSRPKLRQRG